MISSGQCHIVFWPWSWLVSDGSLPSTFTSRIRPHLTINLLSSLPGHSWLPHSTGHILSVLSLYSTHTFSLCSGLAVDYFDGGKDKVSTIPPQKLSKEKGCCYQKTGPKCQGQSLIPSPCDLHIREHWARINRPNLPRSSSYRVQRSMPVRHLQRQQPPTAAKLPLHILVATWSS